MEAECGAGLKLASLTGVARSPASSAPRKKWVPNSATHNTKQKCGDLDVSEGLRLPCWEEEQRDRFLTMREDILIQFASMSSVHPRKGSSREGDIGCWWIEFPTKLTRFHLVCHILLVPMTSTTSENDCSKLVQLG